MELNRFRRSAILSAAGNDAGDADARSDVIPAHSSGALHLIQQRRQLEDLVLAGGQVFIALFQRVAVDEVSRQMRLTCHNVR